MPHTPEPRSSSLTDFIALLQDFKKHFPACFYYSVYGFDDPEAEKAYQVESHRARFIIDSCGVVYYNIASCAVVVRAAESGSIKKFITAVMFLMTMFLNILQHLILLIYRPATLDRREDILLGTQTIKAAFMISCALFKPLEKLAGERLYWCWDVASSYWGTFMIGMMQGCFRQVRPQVHLVMAFSHAIASFFLMRKVQPWTLALGTAMLNFIVCESTSILTEAYGRYRFSMKTLGRQGSSKQGDGRSRRGAGAAAINGEGGRGSYRKHTEPDPAPAAAAGASNRKASSSKRVTDRSHRGPRQPHEQRPHEAFAPDKSRD